MASHSIDLGRLDDARFVASALLPGRFRRPRLRTLAEASGGIRGLRLYAEGTGVGLALPPAEAELLAAVAADRTFEESIRKFFERPDARLLLLGDEDFPALLGHSSDPPVVLFARSRADRPIGALPLPVALVGSRQSSPYGREAAARIAGDLAASGVAIVSGMARGIDSAAHEAAITRGGITLAVLGCGIDIDYPKENAPLARRIVESDGWILSEYPPGTSPLPPFFPERNRIIATLSRGVVVVEAAERSGSLITARLALEEGREVWAVPGSIFSGTSAGCHRLLRDGARLAASAADILADLPPELLQPLLPFAEPGGNDDGADPERPYGWLLEALSIEQPRGVEELARGTGRPIPLVLSSLLEAELDGLARALPGQRYVRTQKRLSGAG